MGWIWTSGDTYPAIWRISDRVWLLLEYNEEIFGREFFNSATNKWEIVPYSLEGEPSTGSPPDPP